MTLSTEALLHMRPGRPRSRTVKRDSPGSPNVKRDQRTRGERPADVVAVARAYRIKDGANPENALHEHYGSTLGRLFLERAISQEQLHAAQRYAICIIQNAKLFGIPSPHPRALDLLMASKGLSCDVEISEEQANEIKGKFRDCRRTLLDCGTNILVGSRVNRVVYGVAIEDWPIGQLQKGDVENLRCGLNVLGQLMKSWDKRPCV
jgi:hypothetical protein